MGSALVALNGFETWAYVVVIDEGLRVRFDIDDWQRLNLVEGQRVPVRVAGREDVWLFVMNATELPPIIWVTLGRKVRVAG